MNETDFKRKLTQLFKHDWRNKKKRVLHKKMKQSCLLAVCASYPFLLCLIVFGNGLTPLQSSLCILAVIITIPLWIKAGRIQGEWKAL